MMDKVLKLSPRRRDCGCLSSSTFIMRSTCISRSSPAPTANAPHAAQQMCPDTAGHQTDDNLGCLRPLCLDMLIEVPPDSMSS